MSADTIVPEPGNPQAWNRYSYVVNSPLKYTDPSGHCFIILCIVAIGAAVVSVAAATEAVAYTAEVVQTGSGWDSTEYWNRVTHPRPETLGTAAVVVATTVAEPLDYLATGVQCLTSGCSVADLALTVVPGAWGAIRKGIDKAVDATRALENTGDGLQQLDNLPDDAVLYNYSRPPSNSGKPRGFRNELREGEQGISCQVASLCNNDPAQGFRQQFGKDPRLGDQVRETTVGRVRAWGGRVDPDGGINGNPIGHGTIYSEGGAWGNDFGNIWDDPYQVPLQ